MRLIRRNPAESGAAYVLAVVCTLATAAIPAPAPKATPADPRLEPPVLAGLVAEAGLVRMTWTDAPETNVPVAGYHVYRRRAGEAAFVRLTRTPVRARLFTDERVPLRQDLEYAIAPVCADPAASKRLILGPDGEGPRSRPKGIRSKGPFDLKLRLVTRFAPEWPGGEPLILARVTVRKLEQGVWSEKDYTVKKGDRIGRPETIDRNGRPVDVDFTTGFEVLAVEPVKVVVPVKVTRPAIDPKTARETGLEEVVVDREVPSWRLRYRDDAGATHELPLERKERNVPRGARLKGSLR
jgi:hypothetical protein